MAQSNWGKTYDEGCLKADLTAARGTNKLRSIVEEEVAVWVRNLWDGPDLLGTAMAIFSEITWSGLPHYREISLQVNPGRQS
jgi:hypothetical protein